MARISSQGSVIMIASNTTAPTASDIVSATKAKPCVITITPGAGDPVVGDIIVPRDTGWNSIEGMPFKVSAVAVGAITLEDSDTSDEVANILIGTLEKPSFLELCRSNFTANNPAGATIDVTTLCDTAHRIVPGLPAIGTWNAAGFYDCGDLALDAAREYYRTGEEAVVDVRLPDGCGFTFMGIINTFDITLGVNAAVTNALGGQVDGGMHFYKTPPVGFVATALRGRTIRPATNPNALPSGEPQPQPVAA